MSTIKDQLASRTRDELVRAATDLAEADLRLRQRLVSARRSAGLTQADVAELLGVKQSSISQFERYDNDPRLSTIRRYALAVGAEVTHSVTTTALGREWTTMASAQSTRVVGTTSAGSLRYKAPADSKRTDFALAA